MLLSSPVIGCVATDKFCAVTCSDATLHCFSVSDGSRLTTVIKLQGPATLLRAQDHFVAVVTTQGQINVWDVPKKKSVVKTSILHLVDQGKTIINLFILNLVHFNFGFFFRRSVYCYFVLYQRFRTASRLFFQWQELPLLNRYGVLVMIIY